MSRHESIWPISGFALHLIVSHSASSVRLNSPTVFTTALATPVRKPHAAQGLLILLPAPETQDLGACTPNKNLPQSLETELCFVLHLLGNKIRETKMFNNMLLDSAVFHSCGWLCPQKCTVKRKVSPCSTRWLGWCVHIRRCLLSLHTGKGFTLWHHNGIFSHRSCWKTLWAIKPALKLLNAQSGKWGVLGNPAWGWAPLRFCAAFPITKGE